MASARPVSGEIMTDPAAAGLPANWPANWPADRAADALSRWSEVVDADYEVLDAGPPRGAPAAAPRPPPRALAPTPAVEGMAMLRPAGAPGLFRVRGGPLFWAAGLAAVLAAFWAAGGHAVIRHSAFPAIWSGERAAFSITGVTSRVDASGLKPVLFVDGEAGNDGSSAAALPPLEIRVTGDDGAVTRYTLGTSGRALAPGQRFAFSSRLDVPRNGVYAVSVAFAE